MWDLLKQINIKDSTRRGDDQWTPGILLATNKDVRDEIRKNHSVSNLPEPENEWGAYEIVVGEGKRVLNVDENHMVGSFKFDDGAEPIQLNSEYSAEIGEDTVKVGCQEFTHDAVKKLYKAIKQFKK